MNCDTVKDFEDAVVVAIHTWAIHLPGTTMQNEHEKGIRSS
jgi:hypothetical protein